VALTLGTVRRAELSEVVEYQTIRRRLMLAGGAATEPWGRVYDDLITVRGGGHDGLRFTDGAPRRALSAFSRMGAL
jgi:hypothetical protein